TIEELDKLIPEEKSARGIQAEYHSGVEDVLYFCRRQLGVVKLKDNRFKLTQAGERLHRYLYTPAFPEELFRLLIQTSTERFTYFYQVYSALNRYVQQGVTTIPQPELRALLEETNRVSKKEIKRLMIACGAIEVKGDTVSLNPRLLGIDPTEVQITQLLNSIAPMIQEEGRLIYPETIKRLETLHPEIDIRRLEPALRSRLWLNASRTVEYIDGIR
ncbi:MAG: hypothetical protein ACE5IO_03845, partial [Thermoplasmata archaeon]